MRAVVVILTLGFVFLSTSHAQDPPPGEEEPGADESTADGMRCRIEFKLKKRKVFVGRGGGCGNVTCGENHSVVVGLKLVDYGVFEWKTVKGKGTFTGVKNENHLYGDYRGGGASLDLGVGYEATTWSKKDSVKLNLSGSGRGAAVSFGGGTLKVVDREPDEVCKL